MGLTVRGALKSLLVVGGGSLSLIALVALVATFVLNPRASRERVHGAEVTSPGNNLPAFPWPPPRPTSFAEVPRRQLLGTATVATWGDVAGKLRGVVDNAGYPGYTWFLVPGGFALVLHIEQFDEHGQGKEPRWIASPSCRTFSFRCIAQTLFGATPGSYRVVAFVVARGPVTFDLGLPITIDRAKQLWAEGSATFPAELAGNQYSPDLSCLVLVYEFEQSGTQAHTVFKDASKLTALNHLRGSGIWLGLGGA